ncbi:MAG: hypothetical protein ABSE41_16610 [Bacteroidota bacterium]|jgi:hypothetical protein
MGQVNYKFESESGIHFPEKITFGEVSVDLAVAEKGAHLLEGEVYGIEPDPNGNLRVFVSLSGEPGESWRLSGAYNGKRLTRFLLKGKINESGFCTKEETISVGTDSGGPNNR